MRPADGLPVDVRTQLFRCVWAWSCENCTVLTSHEWPLVIISAAAVIVGSVAVVLWSPFVLVVVGLLFLFVTIRYVRLWIVLAAAVLPFSAIAGFSTSIGFIALCDVFALVAIVSFLVARRAVSQDQACNAPLVRPVVVGIVLFTPYVVVALIQSWIESDVVAILSIMERIDLVILWLVFGAMLVRAELLTLFLKAFIVSCTAMAAVWVVTPGASGVLGVQKNPSGGFLATAILVVLLSDRSRWRLPILFLLAAGLISSGSRGSILGIAVAAVILIFFVRHWRRVILPGLIVTAAGLIAIYALPATVATRLISQDDSSAYADNIRNIFFQDAINQYRERPWIGVGVGQYQQQLTELQGVATKDPHNVFVLALAEGGNFLFVAFLLLVVGSLIWLLTMPKSNLTTTAILVHVAVFVHAAVDVYWVRGTPAMGWLLIGAAAAATYSFRQLDHDQKEKFPRYLMNSSRVSVLS